MDTILNLCLNILYGNYQRDNKMTDDEPDVYELLGLTETIRPNTPEEDFYDKITSGSSSRMDNMLYFLKHEIEHFHWLLENDITLTKYKTLAQVTGSIQSIGKSLTNEDYIKLMITYYLQMMHLARFEYNLKDDEDGSPLPKLDLDKAVALFMEHEGVRKVIAKQPEK